MDMNFTRALVQIEMQTALCKIWTWIGDSIFYDDNRYAKCASKLMPVFAIKT